MYLSVELANVQYIDIKKFKSLTLKPIDYQTLQI